VIGAPPGHEARPVRGDLTAPEWDRVASFLPASVGRRGRPYEDHRRVVNGILWVLRTHARWRDLPPRYGSWHTCHDRYLRWRRQGLWERINQALREPEVLGV
jgi:transposase